MRAFIVASAILLTGVFTGQGYAQVNFGLSVGDRDGFYLEIGNYYRVPPREVVVIHDRHIDDDEIPVVFFMADAAGVSPGLIADMRRDGWSWREIAFHFHINPAVFYVPAYGLPGRYARFNSYRDWRRIDWRDDDFIRFCNVKFISERYHRHPDEIMQLRAERRNYYILYHEMRREAFRRHQEEWRHDRGNHNGWKRREYNREEQWNHQNDPPRETPRNDEGRMRRHGSGRD
ncbi:MAG: hypothetical protein ACM3Q4_06010 [Acidobacteriota bacterium]